MIGSLSQDESQKIRQDWLTRAKDAFYKARFVEFSFKEIPNGYCPPHMDDSLCSICASRPWLLVATKIGIIRFGWRKRVMFIDWSQTFVEVDAETLFPEEAVTKFEKTIHAWSYEDAERYLHKLLMQLP